MHRPFRIINSIAPIRICDLGGWTDTWFAEYGYVLNIGVYPYAEVQMKVFQRKRMDRHRVIIDAENFGERYEIDADHLVYDRHPLLEAAIDLVGVPKDLYFDVNLYSEAPSGASTGTSAAITVALIGALDVLTTGRMTSHEIALAAQRVETEKLKQQCGIQDQICSAYGGINFIEMTHYPRASVSQIFIPNNIWWELEKRLILIYLGMAHYSSEIHSMVINGLENAGPHVPVLTSLRKAAQDGKNALFAGDFQKFGSVMIENNELQRSLHSKLISEDAQKVIDVAYKNSAIGWKVNGAGGGGGSLTILCGPDASSKRKIIDEVEAADEKFKNIPIYLSRYGLRIWDTPLT
jgi:D-glycero-alpha-D-manno-heptose-7-phosphate kinase